MFRFFLRELICYVRREREKERKGWDFSPNAREREENRFNHWFGMLTIVYMASSTFLWCQWRLGLLEWVEVVYWYRWELTKSVNHWLLIIKTSMKKRKKCKFEPLYLCNRFYQTNEKMFHNRKLHIYIG